MAENRVTNDVVETAIVRASVPGNARTTNHVAEVALLKDIVPGALARVTCAVAEVAVLRASGGGGRSFGCVIG